MGKIANEMTNLATLLNNTADNEADIDGAPSEFRRGPGRPKKIKLPKEYWCGMQVPGEIFSICTYMKNLLIAQGKYAPALDIQIYNCSVQQYLYNSLITKMIEGREHVNTRELTTASESLRRALQSTGLTVSDKKQGITKAETEVNPLATFLDAMNTGEEEQVITKKAKQKKKE